MAANRQRHPGEGPERDTGDDPEIIGQFHQGHQNAEHEHLHHAPRLDTLEEKRMISASPAGTRPSLRGSSK